MSCFTPSRFVFYFVYLVFIFNAFLHQHPVIFSQRRISLHTCKIAGTKTGRDPALVQMLQASHYSCTAWPTTYTLNSWVVFGKTKTKTEACAPVAHTAWAQCSPDMSGQFFLRASALYLTYMNCMSSAFRVDWIQTTLPCDIHPGPCSVRSHSLDSRVTMWDDTDFPAIHPFCSSLLYQSVLSAPRLSLPEVYTRNTGRKES